MFSSEHSAVKNVVSPELQLCSYIGLSPCLLFIVPVLSLWSLGGVIHLVDPEPASLSDCLRAGTRHLIQSQSTVMVSHSLKDLFAFLAFSLGQSQCRPIQFISLACLKIFFLLIWLHWVLVAAPLIFAVAWGIFKLWHVGSSSLTRVWTRAPCFGTMES